MVCIHVTQHSLTISPQVAVAIQLRTTHPEDIEYTFIVRHWSSTCEEIQEPGPDSVDIYRRISIGTLVVLARWS